MDRRGFLAAASLLAASSLAPTGARAHRGAAAHSGARAEARARTQLASTRPGIPSALGIQLYTLRSIMDDPAETLGALSALGYEEVELAGLYGLSPRALRTMLDDHGLRAPSSHVGLDRFEEGARAALFDEAEALGHRWLVCPWIPESLRTPDGYRRLADLFTAAGEAARDRGLSVAYHNHGFEFDRLDDGSTGLGTLLARSEAGLVSFQLDLYWAADAGSDPLDWFAEHPGRWASLHVKDRGEDGSMVSVGDGQLDFAALIDAGMASGAEHVFVEHDNPEDPMDTAARSIAHLRGLRGSRS